MAGETLFDLLVDLVISGKGVGGGAKRRQNNGGVGRRGRVQRPGGTDHGDEQQ